MASDGSDDDDDTDDGDEGFDLQGMNKIQYTPTSIRTPRRVPSGGLGPAITTSATPPPIYDQLDKALERTQIMCEKAAHQYLRDGDCRLEIREAKKSLEEVIEMVEPEYAKLCEMETAEQKESVEATVRVEEGKLVVTRVPSLGEIEVDDELDDEVDIKLTFPRAGRRMPVEITSY